MFIRLKYKYFISIKSTALKFDRYMYVCMSLEYLRLTHYLSVSSQKVIIYAQLARSVYLRLRSRMPQQHPATCH